MLRLFLILILSLAAACTRYQAQPTTPQPQEAKPATVVEPPKPAEKPEPPKNFVCSRLAAEGNTKATCEPEITEPDMHRAVITIDGGRASCALPAGALSVVCGPLFYQAEQPKSEPDKAPKAKSKK